MDNELKPDHRARMNFLARLHTLSNYATFTIAIFILGAVVLHLRGEIPFAAFRTVVIAGTCVVALLLLLVAAAYNWWFLWVLIGGSILFPAGFAMALATGEAIPVICAAVGSLIAISWTVSELHTMTFWIGQSWFDSATLRWAQTVLRSRTSNTEER